jgi:hypothetical protein
VPDAEVGFALPVAAHRAARQRGSRSARRANRW